MKVRDKNFGIETPGETIYFKMVSPAMKHAAAKWAHIYLSVKSHMNLLYIRTQIVKTQKVQCTPSRGHYMHRLPLFRGCITQTIHLEPGYHLEFL